MGMLINKFKQVGETCDVFCPIRKGREGNLFGFVRFLRKYDEEIVLRDLNNIWIASYKFRAFISKFKRDPAPSMDPIWKSIKKEKIFLADKGKHKEGTSSAEVVHVKLKEPDKEGDRNEVNKVDLEYQSSDLEKGCLGNCLTCLFKR